MQQEFTFTQSIFDRLSKMVSRKTGYYVHFDYVYRRRKDGSTYVDIFSNDLVQHAGIMAGIYKTLVIDNFGGGWCDGKKDGVYVFPLHFSYTYKTGGSNGHELERAWYNVEADEWILGNPIKEEA